MSVAREVVFGPGYVDFKEYPYAPSKVYPNGRLRVVDIVEIGLSAAPPEIRTKAAEALFVSAEQRDALQNWASEYLIPCVTRVDVWDLLLEPFLDTEFSAADLLRTEAALAKCGIGEEECKSIRKRVEKAMMAYNFDSMLWDWVHLGLPDLLDAHLGKLSGGKHRLSAEKFECFYWEAMRIAHKAHIL